ncbi:MAG TPA: N-succinylarginine dihydrolase [Miltoncostaeaceae bacterium]|nr:N-succinylarginine dihydrolase [Miltoncostaeaceae bacterium]
MTGAVDLNLDGLVGPTHNYAGLSADNVASRASRARVSNPRAAAREGIAKMRALIDLGVPQGVLPPHERPHLPTLRRLGFTGDDAAVLAAAARRAPELLAACSSASAMWAANAATVAPSADAADGRVHLTPANLIAHAHRSIEAPTTHRVLRAIFADRGRFAVHEPLPATPRFADEGAANHVRLAPPGRPAVHLFVHGGRQAEEASRAVARGHELGDRAVRHAAQHPEAVDAGAFHNDVVMVGHRDVLLCHERALADQPAVLASLGGSVRAVVVPDAEVPLADAVASYLFNGQLVSDAAGRVTLVAPAECGEVASVAAWLERMSVDSESPLERVVIVGVRQSMRNGGGPACLRLAVPVTDAERAAMLPGALVDGPRLEALEAWVDRHHRDRLGPSDLADPALLDESRVALDELTALLGLGAVYEFQGAVP